MHWEFISLKGVSIQNKSEIWSAVTFKLLQWFEFKCTVWNGNESENPFLISGITKNADFFPENEKQQQQQQQKQQQNIFFFKRFLERQKLKVWVKKISGWKI